MKVYFTADLHLGHENIIKLCNRPFDSLCKMDQVLIRNWNSRVKSTDQVYCLGDFCYRNSLHFNDYRYQLNGDIIFIKGNHDKNNDCRALIETATIHYGGKYILLIHNEIDAINYDDFDLVLCGHSHNVSRIKKKNTTYFINVGVDQWNFIPITINEIIREISKYERR